MIAEAKQLELELPIEYQNSDNYKEEMAKYSKMEKVKGVEIYLCFNHTTKRFFVSKWWKRETIESYKTIKIIH